MKRVQRERDSDAVVSPFGRGGHGRGHWEKVSGRPAVDRSDDRNADPYFVQVGFMERSCGLLSLFPHL